MANLIQLADDEGIELFPKGHMEGIIGQYAGKLQTLDEIITSMANDIAQKQQQLDTINASLTDIGYMDRLTVDMVGARFTSGSITFNLIGNKVYIFGNLLPTSDQTSGLIVGGPIPAQFRPSDEVHILNTASMGYNIWIVPNGNIETHGTGIGGTEYFYKQSYTVA